MQTTLAPHLAQDPRAQEAEAVLRKCVHCGFCLATCPTYNLLGDELDSPRGRIYLIKQVVEGHKPTAETLTHLDRCLTCRNCETTCPSGVEYGHLVDVGRSLVEEQVPRSLWQRSLRWLVREVIAYPGRIGPLVKIGQGVRSLMPSVLARSIPKRQSVGQWPAAEHKRTMLILDGCAQPSMAPATNAATARVLDALGVSLKQTPGAGCCGAIHFHLNDQDKARTMMKRNIDAWWPAIENGAEAVVMTASGCGVTVKDYGHIFKNDAEYAAKAEKISALCKDIVEVLLDEDLSRFNNAAAAYGNVAFHPPCTLQHGQKLPQVTESLLRKFGFTLTTVPDAHVCCGSAGTYSLFQPKLSQQLQHNKVEALASGAPSVVATANIGCQLQLQTGMLKEGRDTRVVHWIELLDDIVRNA